MPYRRRGSSRRGLGLRPVNSNKNIVHQTDSVGATLGSKNIAITVDNAALTSTAQIERGSSIKAIWLSLDFCGLAATGVLQVTHVYLIKNPGANLTLPLPGTEGGSNEKKFIFKQWDQMTMRNQDGNPPYHWEGWIKIPRVYQRNGADDVYSIAFACSSAAGHISFTAIYKWYR